MTFRYKKETYMVFHIFSFLIFPLIHRIVLRLLWIYPLDYNKIIITVPKCFNDLFLKEMVNSPFRDLNSAYPTSYK